MNGYMCIYIYIYIYIYKWHVCLGSYDLDKGVSRESEKVTAKRRAHTGPGEEAKGKWKRFGEQMGKCKGGGQ